MSLSPLPIRLFCDLAARSTVIDLNTSQSALFYRGDDIEVDIGLGQNGALLTGLTDSGAGGIASVTCQLFAAENDSNPAMMAATVPGTAMNLALTQAQWTAGGPANSHAQFLFPNSQTAITLNGQTAASYWLRITAQTSDAPAKTITLLDGPITVKDGPVSSISPPAPAYFRFYTINGNPTPQVYDPVSGHYYNLEIDTLNGVRTLSLGDAPY